MRLIITTGSILRAITIVAGLFTANSFSNLTIIGLRDDRVHTAPHVILGSLGFTACVVASFSLLFCPFPSKGIALLVTFCAAVISGIALTFGSSVTALRYWIPSILYVIAIWPQLTDVMKREEGASNNGKSRGQIR